MAAQKPTRVDPNLPPGEWLVVMRLRDLNETVEYGEPYARALRDLTPGKLATATLVDVDFADGALFPVFWSDKVPSGNEAVLNSSAALWTGLDRLGLIPQVEARADFIGSVDPGQHIARSYEQMRYELTQLVQDNLYDFNIEPPELPEIADVGMRAELELLLH